MHLKLYTQKKGDLRQYAEGTLHKIYSNAGKQDSYNIWLNISAFIYYFKLIHNPTTAEGQYWNNFLRLSLEQQRNMNYVVSQTSTRSLQRHCSRAFSSAIRLECFEQRTDMPHVDTITVLKLILAKNSHYFAQKHSSQVILSSTTFSFLHSRTDVSKLRSEPLVTQPRSVKLLRGRQLVDAACETRYSPV